MLRKLILALVVAVVVTLGCNLLGVILSGLSIKIAVTIGDFLQTYAPAIGILAGLWYFFDNGTFNFRRNP